MPVVKACRSTCRPGLPHSTGAFRLPAAVLALVLCAAALPAQTLDAPPGRSEPDTSVSASSGDPDARAAHEEEWDIERLVREGLEHAPGMIAARASLRKAVNLAESRPGVSLSASGTAAASYGAGPAGSPGAEAPSGFGLNLGLDLALHPRLSLGLSYEPGKGPGVTVRYSPFLRLDAADRAAFDRAMAETALLSAALETELSLRTAYVAAYEAAETRKLREAVYRNAGEHLQVVQARWDSNLGLVTAQQLESARLASMDAYEALLAAGRDELEARYELTECSGLDMMNGRLLPLPEPALSVPDIQELLAGASGTSLRLGKTEAAAAFAEEALRKERRFLPELTLGAGVTVESFAPFRAAPNASVGLSLGILDPARRAAVRNAGIDLEEAVRAVAEIRAAVEREIRLAAIELSIRIERLDALRYRLDRRGLDVKEASIEYDAGRVLAAERTAAELALRAAELEYRTGLHRVLLARYALEAALRR